MGVKMSFQDFRLRRKRAMKRGAPVSSGQRSFLHPFSIESVPRPHERFSQKNASVKGGVLFQPFSVETTIYKTERLPLSISAIFCLFS